MKGLGLRYEWEWSGSPVARNPHEARCYLKIGKQAFDIMKSNVIMLSSCMT